MPARDRDDSPSMFNLSRRKVIIGGTLLAGSLAAGPALPALLPEADTPFMQLSKLLIPHQLDAEIGKRIVAALTTLRPTLAQDVPALLAIASKKDARIVEDFFPDVPEGPLKETALSIISAWYMGVAVDAPDAQVFAYENALMYQPTRDVMTIPSYAKSGPNGWNADAPPLTDMPKF
ncbi:Fructose dehydrogenase small subunit [Paraburkholderia aspalathi]|jgi:hypothetical protein|uniref:Fructose dehydrogenase small subunit n=2 Tax=Burkholderiaceae TaxID=119060 RepID=A0A1I7CSI4_9BURK|nr:sorbitol dehydrogenase family protein [Paraburkholderia aspalathi]MBK3819136.1 sorbitol dehydrogenase [Paraburkholderia aspalathi]MBK3830961.1 sorbitol dehydrogenase [Paraburkholderia aspalathi]MBK3840265.1 sorbitol dehydrogenase [Paraburkholderia aspalathi]MBK3860666.1 sorbitol dehydrogenase [Paraburkholderia aspalathi]CAE6717207.1 Fructose dehydrogenase small subunit [Paraburkholderia aspalathi]